MLDELLWQQHSLGLQELLFFIHLREKRVADSTSRPSQDLLAACVWNLTPT